MLLILAKLSGEDQPSGIADWIESRGNLLGEAFHLSWSRMPHHYTVRRIVEEAVLPEERDRVLSEHLQSLPGVGHSVLVAIDGKILPRKDGAPSTQRIRAVTICWLPIYQNKGSC